MIEGYDGEVVDDFKLLVITIDQNIFFNKYLIRLNSSVDQKLHLIKKLFYLSLNIEFQFFKTFIQPNFDYWSSHEVYLKKTLLIELNVLIIFVYFD